VVFAMLPFTWVLQLDGCTETVEGRATGYDLLRDLDLTAPDALLVAMLALVALLAPKMATYAASRPSRTWTHVAGLVATGVLVGRGVTLILGTTQVRTVQPAGILVLLALLAAFVDAIGRVALSAMERVDHDRRVRVSARRVRRRGRPAARRSGGPRRPPRGDRRPAGSTLRRRSPGRSP
jgi:hypothetical protein